MRHHGYLAAVILLLHTVVWEWCAGNLAESTNRMTEIKASAPGTDWTKLLTDPDIVRHLGELLQAYRDAEPARRDQVLRDTMRKIKSGARKVEPAASSPAEVPVTTAPAATPPFEPDIFTPCWGQDRRRYPRMKCFVAVELRVEGSPIPVWGNLSNTSLGGSFVETATPLKTGVKLEIGLWVANGKIWVKGLILSGIVTRSNPSFGVRLKFDSMEADERETLRHFLKFVEGTTKSYQSQQGYLAQMRHEPTSAKKTSTG
jgi:PilZ domain